MVSSAPTRHLQFRSRCRFISSTLRNGRSQPSSTERSDRCRSDQSQVLSGALGDERDVGIGRQVHQQLDTPTRRRGGHGDLRQLWTHPRHRRAHRRRPALLLPEDEPHRIVLAVGVNA